MRAVGLTLLSWITLVMSILFDTTCRVENNYLKMIAVAYDRDVVNSRKSQ